jgi:hypothetical protein
MKKKIHNNTTLNSRCKEDGLIFDNPIRQLIYELFLTGRRFSVVAISHQLDIPDPRSHIRYIRDAGVQIESCWVKTKFSRYKLYYLKGGTYVSR